MPYLFPGKCPFCASDISWNAKQKAERYQQCPRCASNIILPDRDVVAEKLTPRVFTEDENGEFTKEINLEDTNVSEVELKEGIAQQSGMDALVAFKEVIVGDIQKENKDLQKDNKDLKEKFNEVYQQIQELKQHSDQADSEAEQERQAAEEDRKNLASKIDSIAQSVANLERSTAVALESTDKKASMLHNQIYQFCKSHIAAVDAEEAEA